MNNKEYNNMREIINDIAVTYADKNAFILKNSDKTYREITFKEFAEDIRALGTGLLKQGFKGKKVAIIGKNRYEWAVSYYAVVNGLGIVVPLDKGLPEQEIENSLVLSGAEVIIFEEKNYEPIKKILEKKTTKLKTLICMDEIEGVQSVKSVLEKGQKEIKKGNNKYSKLKIDNNKTNIIIFTSGTTSIAKAVELSHRNIASNINGLNKAEKIYDTDVNMAFLPFHHTLGCTGLLFFMSNGAATVFCDGLRHIQTNLKEYKVTVFFCVPLIIEAMHKKIMNAIEAQGKIKKVRFAQKLSKFLLKFGIDIRRKLFKEIIDNLGGAMRFVVSGAAAIDKQVALDFNSFGILTVQGYGLTETSPVLCAENEDILRTNSIGKPLYNVTMKIDKPNEEGIGEIIAKGPNVMKGYYNNKEATKEVLKKGWFHTGDLGKMDKDGYFYICGRKKNVIVLKNGKNIYPEELEILLCQLPYVSENIVFGIPKDDDLMLSAKIVYNKDYVKETFGDISEDDLQETVWKDIKNINSTLANYKHIKHLILTDEPMIKTTTNKVKRADEIKKCIEEYK